MQRVVEEVLNPEPVQDKLNEIKMEILKLGHEQPKSPAEEKILDILMLMYNRFVELEARRGHVA